MLSRFQITGRRFLTTSASTRQSVTAQTSADVSDVDSSKAEYLEMVHRAQQKYMQHPDAYHNFDLSKVDFVKQGMWPQMLYDGENSALSHVSPFLPIYFAKIGPYGNAGENKYKSEETITPAEASVTMAVANSFRETYLEQFPELEEFGFAAEFGKYKEFVNAVRDKYISHLCGNIEAYEQLKKYRSYDMVTSDILHKMIERATTNMSKSPTKEPDINYVISQRQVYIKPAGDGPPPKFVSNIDSEVYQTTGKVRWGLKLYNEKNEVTPWTYSPSRNDIGSFRMRFRPSLVENGHSMRLSIMNGCVIPRIPYNEAPNSPSVSLYGVI